MAGGGVAALGVKTERAAQYKGRMTLAVATTCLVAAVGGAIFGYDIGISGTYLRLRPRAPVPLVRVRVRVRAALRSSPVPCPPNSLTRGSQQDSLRQAATPLSSMVVLVQSYLAVTPARGPGVAPPGFGRSSHVLPPS